VARQRRSGHHAGEVREHFNEGYNRDAPLPVADQVYRNTLAGLQLTFIHANLLTLETTNKLDDANCPLITWLPVPEMAPASWTSCVRTECPT
jgi:hypothetical protein